MRILYSIRWKLTASYLLVVVAAILSLGFYFAEQTERNYISDLRAQLEAEARAIGTAVFARPNTQTQLLVRQLGTDFHHRVTIVRSDGRVLADSQHSPQSMGSHSDRQEIKQALRTGRGYSVRHSNTINTDMMYVAVRYASSNGQYVVRVSEPLSQLYRATRHIWVTFGIAALIALCIAAAVAMRLAGKIVGPISTMTKNARRIAQGDFGLKVTSPSVANDEVLELSTTLNSLAAELRRTVRELREDKRKMDTVFDKTDDGLLVLDNEGRIETINPAASSMIPVPREGAIGRTIIEATLNHEFGELVERVIRTDEQASLEVVFNGRVETHVYVYVTPLGQPGKPEGVIVVMHDVTKARQVDAMRRDFAANVGHELRTPLASIRAMAETIALRGNGNPDVAKSFAESIVDETERVVRLADDLLEIGMIESERRPVREEPLQLSDAVADVIARLSPAAEKKEVQLKSEISDGIKVNADKDDLWQILVNLVSNALTYTPSGGKVNVRCSQQGGYVAISVVDTGIGIPAEDIPRIFERFYRVDKARSRASGGTGLGLSIVKHLVESHGGRVWVESEPGQGSTFTFTIKSADRQ